MDLELDQKTAFVAAGSRGIGKACAMALAREGANVAICARDPEQLNATADEILKETGRQVLTINADLLDSQAIKSAVATTESAFGPVELLVANSVGPPPGNFEKFNENDWSFAFESAVLSTIRLVKAVLPGMLKRRAGIVVGIQSSSVKEPIPGLILSNTVRPGIAGLMNSLAQEYGPMGLRFNVLCPGRVLTDRFMAVERAHGQPLEERLARAAAELPLRRFGDPKEIADAVVFLLSARASYITGSVLSVDGGKQRGLF